MRQLLPCLASHAIVAGGGDGEERLSDARGRGGGRGGRRGGRHRGSLWHLRGLQVQNSRNPQGALCGPNHAGECGRLRLVPRSWQFDTLWQKLLVLPAASILFSSLTSDVLDILDLEEKSAMLFFGW